MDCGEAGHTRWKSGPAPTAAGPTLAASAFPRHGAWLRVGREPRWPRTVAGRHPRRPPRTSGSVEESTGARARKLESCIGGDGHTALTTSWRQSPVTNQVWLGSRAFTESSTRRSLTRGPSAGRTCTGCAEVVVAVRVVVRQAGFLQKRQVGQGAPALSGQSAVKLPLEPRRLCGSQHLGALLAHDPRPRRAPASSVG